MGAESVTVCFTGNPNCGKTTLFNAYTGAGKKTANWPGVTVALSEGSLMHRGRLVHLVDTPGIYSLDPYTMEETVTRQCIRDQEGGCDHPCGRCTSSGKKPVSDPHASYWRRESLWSWLSI